MVWENKSVPKKKGKQNRLKENPVIAFHSDLNPTTLAYLKQASLKRKKAEFINQAIEQRYFLLTNKRQFLINMIKEDYALVRFLLRKIGGEKW